MLPANARLSAGRQERGRAGRQRDGGGGGKQGQRQGAERARPPGQSGLRQGAQASGRQAARRDGKGAGSHLGGREAQPQPGSGSGLRDPAHPPACRLPTPRGQFSKHWKCKLCHGDSYRSHVAVHPHVYFERSGLEIVCNTLHLLSSAKNCKEKTKAKREISSCPANQMLSA